VKSRRVNQSQDAFRALSDPTRRDILTLLRKREDCSAGEIADAFPNISRPAVSRHLRVLREAGLAVATGIGREQRYTLSLARLARVHHDWFAQFDDVWGASLAALKGSVESGAAARRRTKRISAENKKKRRA
jgi:DNA-binding transcriptional ArsR family regulator